VLAGSLLKVCGLLLERGIHPTIISEGYQLALYKALEVMNAMAVPIELS